jgi:ubiquinone/menaquinone biosynthesis C-methylase UbiE
MIHSDFCWIKSVTRKFLFLAFIIALSGCSSKIAPYECGPVMNQKDINSTFGPILKFMDLKSGDSFADVGGSSGALTVMMSTLLSDVNVYVEDIDTTCLKSENFNKIINFYSIQSGIELRNRNRYHFVVGTFYRTNLPDNSVDKIYTNATIHVFQSADSIVADLSKKLKPGGVLFIRDSFKGDHGEAEFCSDPKCAKPLLSIDELMELMKRNGYKLMKETPDMSGYPVFGFAKAEIVNSH